MLKGDGVKCSVRTPFAFHFVPLQFSTLWRAFLTCWLIMLNDQGVELNFVYMQGWQYVAAILWWFSFTAILVLVLLNVLIAIVVDAFMDIKDGHVNGMHGSGLKRGAAGEGGEGGGQQGPTTISEDLRVLLRRAWGRHGREYWRYERLLKHLYSLSPPDFRKAEVRPTRPLTPSPYP